MLWGQKCAAVEEWWGADDGDFSQLKHSEIADFMR